MICKHYYDQRHRYKRYFVDQRIDRIGVRDQTIKLYWNELNWDAEGVVWQINSVGGVSSSDIELAKLICLLCNDSTEVESGYGYFCGGDPNRFFPDSEACTTQEVLNWSEACKSGRTDFPAHSQFGIGGYEYPTERAILARESLKVLGVAL